MLPDAVRADVEAFLQKAARDLFGVAPRYPGWEPAVGSININGVLAAAERILLWVAARTSPYGIDLAPA
jgi:hypothetical protein